MKTTLILGIATLLGSLPLMAQGTGGHASNAGSCCSGAPTVAAAPGNHGGHSPAVSAATAAALAKLDGTARVVFDNYLTVQTALASDSMEKVTASAELLAKAIRADSGKPFPAEIAGQASALAQAKDLAAARKAFQPLSQSLVQHVKAGKVPAGTLFEVYCPMAKASWLQADKTVRNPYFGRAMLDCGVVRPG